MNQQRFELLQDLHAVGLPYHLLGGNSSIWRDDLTGILSTLALLDREHDLGDLPRDDLYDLLDKLRIDDDDIYDQIDRDGRAPDLVDRTAVVGGTRATVDAREINEDASAYPRRESEITDFDKWTKIKRPLVPSLAFDVAMGEAPDPSMYDVVRVPSGSDDRGLEIVERNGAIPLSELCERESESENDRDRNRRDRSSGPLPEF